MSTTLRLSRRARVLPVTVTRPPRRDPRVAIYPNTIFTKITSAFSTTSGTAFRGSARVSQRRARAATKKKDASREKNRRKPKRCVPFVSREPWGGGVPRKGGPPPVTDGLTRERRRDGPERRLDAPRMYCVAVINPMSCPRGLVALTYPLVNALCPRPHFSRKRCSFRIANALNVSSTDWQNVHRVIARPVVAAAAPGAAPGASGECAAEPTVGRFFASSTSARFRTVPTPTAKTFRRGPSFWAFPAKPTHRGSDRSLLYCTFETLFVGFREPLISRSPRRSIGIKSVRRK